MRTKLKEVSAAAPPCSVLMAKVAFEIPAYYQVDETNIPYGKEVPDGIVDGLFALFHGAASFEQENLCTPPILIVDTSDISKKWVDAAKIRINDFLQNSL